MKFLFICTHNRCRSILAEAISNHLGGSELEAKSAGSQPVGQVHPLSIKFLKESGISTEGLCSQSWDEHENYQPDVVFTVCDSAAAEQCPVWFGDSIVVHWGLQDPSKIDGSDEDIRNAFLKTIALITRRIEKVLELNLKSLTKNQIEENLCEIGDKF